MAIARGGRWLSHGVDDGCTLGVPRQFVAALTAEENPYEDSDDTILDVVAHH